MSSGTYNTYVISTDGFNAVKVVGQLVPLNEADRLEGSLSKRYGGIDYFVQSYADGSERDIECKKDLKKLARVK